MIFHENHLADNSLEISYLILSKTRNLKMLQNLSSAAVVIGALRFKIPSVLRKFK